MTKKIQLCARCEQPTGRCEEDAVWVDGVDDGPFCEECGERIESEMIFRALFMTDAPRMRPFK